MVKISDVHNLFLSKTWFYEIPRPVFKILSCLWNTPLSPLLQSDSSWHVTLKVFSKKPLTFTCVDNIIFTVNRLTPYLLVFFDENFFIRGRNILLIFWQGNMPLFPQGSTRHTFVYEARYLELKMKRSLSLLIYILTFRNDILGDK